MASCLKCGAEHWQVVSRVGAITVLRCKHCGTEETVHSHNLQKELAARAADQWFALSVHLPNQISAHQIEVLRQTFRKLELMSPAAVKELALAAQPIAVGQYPASDIARFEIEQAVESIGISLDKQEVPSPLQPKTGQHTR